MILKLTGPVLLTMKKNGNFVNVLCANFKNDDKNYDKEDDWYWKRDELILSCLIKILN